MNHIDELKGRNAKFHDCDYKPFKSIFIKVLLLWQTVIKRNSLVQ